MVDSLDFSVDTLASDPAPCQLVSASRFTIEQLTAAYNQTRVDYLVPMPMNTTRLAEYIKVHDVDLEHSVAAVDGDQIQGLGMIAIRPGRVWFTRLGVLPGRRRRGIGRAITQALLAAGEAQGARLSMLEVIEHNLAAYNLFIERDFKAERTVLVLRRPPGPSTQLPAGNVHWLEKNDALALLERRPDRPTWLMETDSLAQVDNLRALTLSLVDGSRGWLVFQQQNFRAFPYLLSRLVPCTEQGDPVTVGRALLAHLYQAYPFLDTHTENIPLDDPHLPAFFQMGYMESFRRIEMRRPAG